MFLALFENALTSDVRMGENSGVRLRHDYVVREWVGPFVLSQNGVALHRTLSVPAASQHKSLGVAAFIQSPSGAILQALALPSCS